MNSFRDGILNGRAASGPVMPAKKSRGADGDALTATVIPRSETRTHNQRGESRDILAGGEAGLTVGRRSYVVDLLNLSGGGAMIRTNLPLQLWKQVHLELGESGSVECVVRWIREDRIGLEFAHETQVGGDLAKRDAMLLDTISRNFPEVAGDATDDQPAELAAGAEAQRRGGLRHPLIWSGEIHFDHDSTKVRLRNVSETGAMVDCTKPLPEGAEVLLDLGGAGQFFAAVTWSRGDQLGLKFQHPFDISCLAQSRPEVASKNWTRPEYLTAEQDTDTPWAEPWERLSLDQLKDELEGFRKR
jgi:hypothetical protein